MSHPDSPRKMIKNKDSIPVRHKLQTRTCKGCLLCFPDKLLFLPLPDHVREISRQHQMKQIALYAVTLAVLAIALQLAEYRFLVLHHSLEIYGAVLAILFTALGIYAGKKLTTPKEIIIEKEVAIPYPVQTVAVESVTAANLPPESLNISKREYEILELMSKGLSNQEIADQLFVSVNTVKTHASNLFSKLDVKRRTQAVMKAKEIGLIQ